MNSLERALAVMDGKIPDRVPIAMHNFLFAARYAGMRLTDCLQSGEMMAESHLKVWRAFQHDLILVENGTTAMAGAFGCGIGFSEDTAPRVIDPVLKSLDDIDRLQIPDPRKAKSLVAVQRAVRILRRELGNEVFIMGRADQAPMALAACLRGHETFLLDLALAEDPKVIERLLDICLAATTRYALALQAAGAHGTCIGEFGTDVISPVMYRQYALPRMTRFFQAAGSKAFKVAVHQCGNTVAVLKDMASSGADFLELDAVTDMKQAKAATRGKTAVLGMVDPANVMHLGSRELVREKTRLAIEVMGPGGGFIVGPGCALAPETPTENVAAMIDSARVHGRYRSDGSVGR